MKKIAYLLHRFPAITDTFIKREIRFLQKAGTPVDVISVWKPRDSETTPAILSEWAKDTAFMLPRPVFSAAYILLKAAISSPFRFLRTLRQALATARPGIRGFVYQMVYFLEAVLAADALKRNNIDHVHNHIGDQAGTVTMYPDGIRLPSDGRRRPPGTVTTSANARSAARQPRWRDRI